MEAQMAIKRAAEEAQEAMAELLVWQQEQNAKDAELRRQAAAERQQTAQNHAGQAAKPAAAQADKNGRHGATRRGGPKVEGCIIEDVTEDHGEEGEKQRQRPQPKQQQRSAAQHTYDHYSQRWERFDADAAMRSDDDSDGGRPSTAAPKPATGRRHGGAGAPPAATGRSPPTPAVQPVLPSRRQAAKRAGTAEAGSGASAEEWREVGNARFKAGDYAGAREAYTASLAVSPTCLAHANRAMAALKAGDAESAEADSTAAVSLDATYLKAFQRRAAARQMLGRRLEAIEDLETALRLQPTSATLTKERADAVAALIAAEGLTPPATPNSVAVTLACQDRAAASALRSPPAAAALPVSAEATPSAGGPPQARSQPPLSAAPPLTEPQSRPTAVEQPINAGVELHPSASRRISLPTDGTQDLQRRPSAAGLTDAAAVKTAPERSPVQSAETGAGPSTAPEMALDDRVIEQKLKQEAAEAAVLSPVSAAAGASDVVQQPHAQPGEPPHGHEPCQNGTSVKLPHDAAAKGLDQPGEGRSQQIRLPAMSAVLPTEGDRPPAAADQAKRKATLRPATSGQEFERNWRRFKGALPLQRAYLQLLDPAAIPSVFKSSLTPALLGESVLCILTGIAASSGGSEDSICGTQAAEAQGNDMRCWIWLLEGFSAVPRFGMMKIAIPSANKAEIRSAWEAATTAVAGSADAQELARLRILYGL